MFFSGGINKAARGVRRAIATAPKALHNIPSLIALICLSQHHSWLPVSIYSTKSVSSPRREPTFSVHPKYRKDGINIWPPSHANYRPRLNATPCM